MSKASCVYGCLCSFVLYTCGKVVQQQPLYLCLCGWGVGVFLFVFLFYIKMIKHEKKNSNCVGKIEKITPFKGEKK